MQANLRRQGSPQAKVPSGLAHLFLSVGSLDGWMDTVGATRKHLNPQGSLGDPNGGRLQATEQNEHGRSSSAGAVGGVVADPLIAMARFSLAVGNGG